MTLKKVSKVKVPPKERDSVYLAQQDEKSRKKGKSDGKTK